MLRCEWKHRKYQCFLTLVKKNTVNYSVFGHLTLKNHGICSGFCFSPRKNTVNNSNFAVFSCFSLFFELRWSAIHGYQILRVFFSDNQYTFGCFWSQWPTSLAVTSGCPTMRCGRLPSRSDVNMIKYAIFHCRVWLPQGSGWFDVSVFRDLNISKCQCLLANILWMEKILHHPGWLKP